MINKIIIFFIVTVCTVYANGLKEKSLKSEKDYVRHIIYLPKLMDEEKYKVELLIGKNMHVAQCNQYRFEGEAIVNSSGNIIVDKIGRMRKLSPKACKNSKKEDKFISIYTSETQWIEYNSQYPIVIFIPKWYEVRYQIWESKGMIKKALIK